MRTVFREKNGGIEMDAAAADRMEKDYREYYRDVYLRALSVTGNRLDAETAVQEAFLTACQKHRAYFNSANRLEWMKKTAEHKALHILQERRNAEALFISMEELEPGSEPFSEDAGAGISELKEICLAAVSREDYDLFIQIAMKESSFWEEAQKRGISMPACYRRFERIRGKLQRALGDFHKP